MCFLPLQRLWHWGPLAAIGTIKCVTGMTIHCSSMWWPATTTSGVLNTACFMSLSGLTLYHFLSALFHGPGYLPFKWKPRNEKHQSNLQFCTVCLGYKAPRSHHCRKCGRCILKMDHHCPWINNCVGWGNHAHFTSFLLFAVLGSFHASIVLSCSLYRAIHRYHYIYYGTGKEPIVYLGVYGLVFCVFSLGLAIGVVLAVGMLFYFQMRAIVRNRTVIEDWILEKAQHRRKYTSDIFIYPYNLGVWKNIKQVINLSCTPVGDGIHWPVRDGCDQYTLTREQLEQKNVKRQRSKMYKIVEPASGSWISLIKGTDICLHLPGVSEGRLKLNVGDMVLVTRWRKHSLFGEKIDEQGARIKGWFPRKCAVELMEENDLVAEKKSKKNL